MKIKKKTKFSKDKNKNDDETWEFNITHEEQDAKIEEKKKLEKVYSQRMSGKISRKDMALTSKEKEKARQRKANLGIEKTKREILNQAATFEEESEEKRKSRAHYLEDDEYEEQEYSLTDLTPRAIGMGIDAGITALIFGIANFENLIVKTEDIYFLIVNSIDMSDLLDDTQLNFLLPTINFIFLYILLMVIPTLIMKKSFGKHMMNLKIYSFMTEVPTMKNLIQRELIFKPLSIFSIFGILIMFFNKEIKCWHDTLADTLVVKDN